MKKLSVVLAIVAIAAIVLAFVFNGQKADLQKTVDSLKAQVAEATDKVPEAAQKTIDDLTAKVEELTKGAEEASAKAAEELAAVKEEAAKELAAAKEEAAKALEEAAGKTQETVEAAAEPAAEAVEEVKEEAAKAAEAATEAVEEVKEEAAKAAEGATEAVEEKIAEATEETAAAVAAVAEAAAPAEEAKSDRVQIIIWSTFTDDQDKYLNKTAEAFNASQEKYQVVIQPQPNQGFTSTVYSAVMNNEGPDIIFNYGSEAAKYVSAEKVANLDEYIYDDEMGIPDFDNLLPAYLKAEINGFEDGHIHYLPGYTTGPILFYNKTLLNELNLKVPTTWKELETVCEAIKTAKPEVTPFGVDSLTDIVQTLMLENGNGYIDVANKKVLFDNTVDVVKWFGEMAQKGYFAITAPSGGYFSNDFNAGLVAMYYGSCAGVPYINPNGFEYDVAPAPSTKDEHAVYTIWNRGPIVFSANGQDHVEGAYLFVKYMMTTPEVAEGWAEAVLALTPWLNAQKVEGYDAYVASQPALAAVQGNFDIGVSFPNVTGASETRDALKELATVVAAGADPAEALAKCVETCNNALQGK